MGDHVGGVADLWKEEEGSYNHCSQGSKKKCYTDSSQACPELNF